MELHKAVREIIGSKGTEMICNPQIINYLLDYQAFKEIPATKLILKAIIDSGYAENILALINTTGWEKKFKLYQQEFINSYGYKEDFVTYVFDSMAFGVGLKSEVFCLLENDKNISLIDNNDEQEHICFKGIQINGNIVDFVGKMQNLGYKLDESDFLYREDSNIVDMRGNFAGIDNCRIYIGATSKSHTVWSVSVCFFEIFEREFLNKEKWSIIKERYYKLKERLTYKYGNPGYCKEEFEPPYYDGCGKELEALQQFKLHYKCYYEVKGGIISLNLDQLSYHDDVNYDLGQKEKYGYIDNDL